MSVLAGSRLEPVTFGPIGQPVIDALAVIFGDPNPIHLDPAAAGAAGLGERTIAQGPAGYAFVTELLRAGVPGGRLHTLDVRLLGMVHCGDVVVAGGQIDALTDTTAVCRVWLEVRGDRVLEGTATLDVEDR